MEEGRRQRPPRNASSSSPTVSRWYGWMSVLAAVIAIITAPQPTVFPVEAPSVVEQPEQPLSSFSWRNHHWWFSFVSTPPPEEPQPKQNQHKLPSWLRWLSPSDEAATAASHTPESCSNTRDLVLNGLQDMLHSILDPSLVSPNSTTLTDLIDKILTSTPRLLAIANLLLCGTYLLHTLVADWFLGRQQTTSRSNEQRLGGFLVFKLLLISAVVAPDTLDLLILLSWYTLLSFLRSLAHLCATHTNYTTQSGQAPRPGVIQLLCILLLTDFVAAAVCVALFHGAGWGMVILLTCDCALLAMDVVSHILLHLAQVLEVQQSQTMSALEEEQVRVHNNLQQQDESDDDDWAPTHHSESSLEQLQQDSRRLDRRMEVLEQQHARRLSILDSTIFGLQLLTHILTVGHFVHIWSLHGVQFTLIDGVLALHLHSALSSGLKKIAERRNLHRIARDLDGMFDNASELDLRKAAASNDVCCICLGTMSTGNVKKVGCGHLYHTSCLREVVERARSMEAARCPLCRASVLDGRHGNNASRGQQREAAGENAGENEAARGNGPPEPNATGNNNGAAIQGEHALFRFSTDNILPAWLPVPAFSFEVVRRSPVAQEPAPEANRNNNANNDNANQGAAQQPQQQQQDQRQSFLRRLLVLAGALPMSPEEEAAALEQLVDMFPQYDRSDLLRELRQRGSAEGVAESIIMGAFTAEPRGAENWQDGAVEAR